MISIPQGIEILETTLHSAAKDFCVFGEMGYITLQINTFNNAIIIHQRLANLIGDTKANHIWHETFGSLDIKKDGKP